MRVYASYMREYTHVEYASNIGYITPKLNYTKLVLFGMMQKMDFSGNGIWQDGKPGKEIAKELGVSRETIYRYLKANA